MSTIDSGANTVFNTSFNETQPFVITSDNEFHGQVSFYFTGDNVTVQIQAGGIPLYKETFGAAGTYYRVLPQVIIGGGTNVALSVSGAGAFVGAGTITGILKNRKAFNNF